MERERKRESLNPHRALAISLSSFSESSKKRDTTSTTKSGLLSSWSCWSCKNWASKIPFTHQQNQAPQNQNQRVENEIKKKKKAKYSLTDQTYQTNKTKQKPQTHKDLLINLRIFSGLPPYTRTLCTQPTVPASDPTPCLCLCSSLHGHTTLGDPIKIVA